MDPVHILMVPVHGPGPRRGSMFCTFPIFSGIEPISDEIVMIEGKGGRGGGGEAMTALVKLNVSLCCFII